MRESPSTSGPFWGYHSSGALHHGLDETIVLLAEMGYAGIAITLDRNGLDPFAIDLRQCLRRIRGVLERCRMRCFIETGARYLLDRERKHYPTLVSTDDFARRIRVEFLKRAIDIARELRADGVSFWSGAADDAAETPRESISHRLDEAIAELAAYAERQDVALCLEPEPEMFIERTDEAVAVVRSLNSTALGLTVDIGHLHCLGEPVDGALRIAAPFLRHMHFEDMRFGVHEHLPLGEGEIDFHAVFQSLRSIAYRGGIYLELARHSHRFPKIARESLDFLRGIRQGNEGNRGERGTSVPCF